MISFVALGARAFLWRGWGTSDPKILRLGTLMTDSSSTNAREFETKETGPLGVETSISGNGEMPRGRCRKQGFYQV